MGFVLFSGLFRGLGGVGGERVWLGIKVERVWVRDCFGLHVVVTDYQRLHLLRGVGV